MDEQQRTRYIRKMIADPDYIFEEADEGLLPYLDVIDAAHAYRQAIKGDRSHGTRVHLANQLDEALKRFWG